MTHLQRGSNEIGSPRSWRRGRVRPRAPRAGSRESAQSGSAGF